MLSGRIVARVLNVLSVNLLLKKLLLLGRILRIVRPSCQEKRTRFREPGGTHREGRWDYLRGTKAYAKFCWGAWPWNGITFGGKAGRCGPF